MTHRPNLYPYGVIVSPCLAWKLTQEEEQLHGPLT